MANSALLIIDMQTSYINQSNPRSYRDPYHLSRQLSNINSLVGWAVGRVPVFVAEFYGGGPTISGLSPLFPEGPLGDYFEKVVPCYDYFGWPGTNSSSARFREGIQLFVKHDMSAFVDTGLESCLSGVDTLVVAGVNASDCVFETINSAILLGKKIITSDVLISDPSKFYDSYRHSVTCLKKNTNFVQDSASALKVLS